MNVGGPSTNPSCVLNLSVQNLLRTLAEHRRKSRLPSANDDLKQLLSSVKDIRVRLVSVLFGGGRADFVPERKQR
jgi:hypothetical protein